jgi:diaminopimelate decarboxylase
MFGVELSHDLDVGDAVAIWQTGAYTLVYAARAFNGISAPSAYLLDRGV